MTPDTHRAFAPAAQEAETAAHQTATPQTADPAYRLAFQDGDFLLRDDLRPVRFQLELMKAELGLTAANVGSTFVFYGSARVPAPADVTPDTPPAMAALSRYVPEARALARLASENPGPGPKREYVVCTGGGPSFMEAANRGAADAAAPSIGLNIVLPHEQLPNPYVTPGLSFQFHYFALRKMHFLMRARAVAVFPGGFGTFDELFELLTLLQTGKIGQLPILLFGRAFWERAVGFDALAEAGLIGPGDGQLFTYVETARDAWDAVRAFDRGRAV